MFSCKSSWNNIGDVFLASKSNDWEQPQVGLGTWFGRNQRCPRMWRMAHPNEPVLRACDCQLFWENSNCIICDEGQFTIIYDCFSRLYRFLWFWINRTQMEVWWTLLQIWMVSMGTFSAKHVTVSKCERTWHWPRHGQHAASSTQNINALSAQSAANAKTATLPVLQANQDPYGFLAVYLLTTYVFSFCFVPFVRLASCVYPWCGAKGFKGWRTTGDVMRSSLPIWIVILLSK